MAVAVPNSRSLLSHAEVEHILHRLTRTPEHILGEPPLGPLPPSNPRRNRLSYEAGLAIMRRYTDPLTVLGEPSLPAQLPPRPSRKRPLASDQTPDDNRGKRRKKQPTYPPLNASGQKGAASTVKPNGSESNRKLKAEPTIHKPLKVTVKLPTKSEPALRRSISPELEQLPTKSKSEKVVKSSSAKSRTKDSRREKPLPRLRSSPAPHTETKEARRNILRSSPAPQSDAKETGKAKDRHPFRSSPAPLMDAEDARRDVDRPKSTASPLPTSESKESRRNVERPMLRSSPAHATNGKDSRNTSDRPRRKHSPVELSDSEDVDKRRSKSSPAKHVESKHMKRETEKVGKQRSGSRLAESKSTSAKSMKKPPTPPKSVPLSRPAARLLRSEPAPPRSSSPEVARKSESTKFGAANRTSSTKERRGEKTKARRRDGSVELDRRDEKGSNRKWRESSVDSAPPRSKARESGKRKHRPQDGDLSVDEQPVSRAAERERSSEKEYERLSDRDVLRGKSKEKERKALRDHRRSVDRDSDFEKSRRREERVSDRDGYGERETRRERNREMFRSKVPEKTRDRGLKRDLEGSGEVEKERDRKTMRKDNGQGLDTTRRQSREPEDAPVSKGHQAHSKGPVGFRSEPMDKALSKNNREVRNDGSTSQKEPETAKEITPRKGLLRFRSKPAHLIKETAAAESKSTTEGSRNGKEAASPASMDPLLRPTNHTPTDEELRVSAKELQQLGAEQREFLSQFDSLTKLCDDFLSKEKHDEFEETAKKAFDVFFKCCLKQETEMRLRKRTHREWAETRREVLSKYKYLARQFATQRISELEKLGRTRTARFLSHQVHKIYVRIFILQRCWNKEQRSGENEMKALMNHLRREGPAVDKNKVLTQRKTGLIANLLNDYANIVCLFDAIVSDWTDGDNEAGFEMTMPF